MREIKVPGFGYDASPDSQPSVCVFGEDNTGTTRFGCTAPCSDGAIGWLAIDKNSKITVEKYKEEFKVPILINQKPFMTHAEAMKMALEEDPKEVKAVYVEVFKRITEAAIKLAEHKDVESIVLDRASQIFDYILFSHFGRRNQIESFQRGAPNQDMIDLINALSTKNLVLVCKASEIWVNTTEIDRNTGRVKQKPSGKFKPDGFGGIGKFVTATIELTAQRKKFDLEDEDEAYNKKYKCKIVTCKGNTLLEGQDLTDEGVCGKSITWDSVMTAIGVN